MTISPVLFLVFNRPALTEQVFEAIRLAQPPRLYIAADGPRETHPNDAERCARVREIAERIDWQCEVHTLFRDANLGCRRAVSEAITWFFAAEEKGIILEDDCLPTQSFFRFCDELLDRYRDDERVMSICGSNTLPPDGEASYFFSRHCRVWGWATWARAWQYYDVDMAGWPAFRDAGQLRVWGAGEPDFQTYWTDVFDRTWRGEIGTWDYQWMFACWANGGLAIRPHFNKVSNLGWGEDATHTLDPDNFQAAAEAVDIDFPLVHPPHVLRDDVADRETQQIQFPRHRSMANLPSKVLRRTIGILTRVERRLRR